MDGTGLPESRTRSPNPRPKRARKELTREQIEIMESSHKNSRTEHREPFQGLPRRKISPREEEYQIQDELDLLLDPEADKYTASPFVQDIKNYPLPARFKIPTMKPYDVTTDPEDHLFIFFTHMHLQTAASVIRCKTFPMFLVGKVRQWFQGLPPRSIRSFSQLARLFAAQFFSSRSFFTSTIHLITV